MTLQEITAKMKEGASKKSAFGNTVKFSTDQGVVYIDGNLTVKGDMTGPLAAQMTIQELGTIMQTGVDVKILILNNHFLGMVRQWQQLFHDKRYSFVDIDSPDYVKVAEAYNIAAKSVSKREELRSALKTMLDHKGSYLLEVHVGKENNVFPMVPQGCSVAEIRLK